MRELFILIAHLLTTVAKLARRGALGAVAAESVVVRKNILPRLETREILTDFRISRMRARDPRAVLAPPALENFTAPL